MSIFTRPSNDLASALTFHDPSDGIGYQARMVAYMTFIQPTIEDELIAHYLGIRLTTKERKSWL